MPHNSLSLQAAFGYLLQFRMTDSAEWNNVKIVSFIISIMMVIVLSLLLAFRTFLRRDMWKFFEPNISIEPTSGNLLKPIFFFQEMLFTVTFSCLFPSLRSIEPFHFRPLVFFSFFRLIALSVVFFRAFSTITMQYWFTVTSAFIKLTFGFPFLALATLFHLGSKAKHPRRLVVHCYHTSRQPPGVRINNSTAGLFGQLFYLCGGDIIAQMSYNYNLRDNGTYI